MKRSLDFILTRVSQEPLNILTGRVAYSNWYFIKWPRGSVNNRKTGGRETRWLVQ